MQERRCLNILNETLSSVFKNLKDVLQINEKIKICAFLDRVCSLDWNHSRKTSKHLKKIMKELSTTFHQKLANAREKKITELPSDSSQKSPQNIQKRPKKNENTRRNFLKKSHSFYFHFQTFFLFRWKKIFETLFWFLSSYKLFEINFFFFLFFFQAKKIPLLRRFWHVLLILNIQKLLILWKKIFLKIFLALLICTELW